MKIINLAMCTIIFTAAIDTFRAGSLTGLWAETLVLNDGKKVDCKIISVVNDSMVAINYVTSQINKFAISDILRVEYPAEEVIKPDNSGVYGLFGGIIGGLGALSLITITDIADPKITVPLYFICVSSGIIIGANAGRK